MTVDQTYWLTDDGFLRAVTRATLVSQLLYASPAWWGYLKADERNRLQAVIKKAIRYGYLPRSFSTLDELTEDSDEKLFFLPGTTPTMFCTASSPNLKTSAITFVNAHTISHYLQTSVLSLNRTSSIECCSEISINLVFRSQCYFASIFYSIAYVFYIINFYFLCYISFYVACAFVTCLIKYLLTYLLGRKTWQWKHLWNEICRNLD